MRRFALLGLVAVLAGAGVAIVLVRGPSPQATKASSHREAPLIAEDPTADTTDVYAFRSLDAPSALTIIANWIPGEDPAAGPNYYRFSESARYYINIDLDGDAFRDLRYQFHFTNPPAPTDSFLGTTQQTYQVTLFKDNQPGVILGSNVTTPPNNIGPRTTPDYETLAEKSIADLPNGGKVFAGQRADPFFADIGAIFDKLAIRRGTGVSGGGKNFFAGYGVHTIALQVPISQLDLPTTPNLTVGVWASTTRPQVEVRQGESPPPREVQISRLGNPLFNEVVVPTAKKDYWNSQPPHLDSQFLQFVQTPILASLLNQLYNIGAPETNRDDLVQVFLTGVPGLNFTGATQADQLRVNLSIPPTDPNAPSSKFSRLGVVGGDLGGYPNGRRLTDDVIDIAERAVAGVLVGNNVPLGDGVDANNVPFLSHFPYVTPAFSGFDNTKGDCAGAPEEVGDQPPNNSSPSCP